MGSRPTQMQTKAKEALLKFPTLSKSAIAKYLVQTYPTLFTSIENARTMIRTLTGASGQARMRYKKVEHTPNLETQFNLPKSEAKDRQFTQIKGAERVLILSDIHFPNHDYDALLNALKFGKEKNIDCIILNGDIMDNEPFTRHDAPPPMISDIKKWFDMVEEFLEMLIKEFNVPIHWLEGNHDAWYKLYLMKKAPMIFHDEYYTLSSRLKLREKKVIWHDENTVVLCGKLPITHGHKIVKGIFSPVNPARGVFTRLKGSMLIGHCHTTSEHSESLLDGTLITCYSTGCLCTLAPSYDPFNVKHNLGFAYVEVEKNGNYKVQNKRIDFKTKEIY